MGTAGGKPRHPGENGRAKMAKHDDEATTSFLREIRAQAASVRYEARYEPHEHPNHRYLVEDKETGQTVADFNNASDAVREASRLNAENA